MQTLAEFTATQNGLVYGRKDGMFVCGINGGGFLSLSDDKSLAVRYPNNTRTLAWAADNGVTLIPAHNRILHYA